MTAFGQNIIAMMIIILFLSENNIKIEFEQLLECVYTSCPNYYKLYLASHQQCFIIKL